MAVDSAGVRTNISRTTSAAGQGRLPTTQQAPNGRPVRVQKGNAMKLLASIRSLLAPSDDPLVILGPGGDFVDHVVERDGRLAVEAPAGHSMQEATDGLAPARSRRHRINRFLAADPSAESSRTTTHEPDPQAAPHLRVHPVAPRHEGILPPRCRRSPTRSASPR